jgi:predicted permease
MLARATTRQREIAIRLAIGAKRWQVVRQLLTESIVIAMLGGALGVIFAWWASHLLLHLVSPGAQTLPIEVTPDRYVLVFTLLVSLATAFLFGLIPALRATRVHFDLSLKDGKASSTPSTGSVLGRSLVVGQVALSLVLLTGAGLFLRSLAKTINQETGFDQNNVLVFSVDESPAGYKEDQRLENLYRQIEEKVGAISGVRAVSFSFFTFDQGSWTSPIYTAAAEHVPLSERVVCHNVVGPGYFAAMGIPRLQGRALGSMDTENSAKVAVVNETFARRFFPNTLPLGQHFRLGGPDSDASNDREIVGVVKDAKYESLKETARPAAYYPHAQRIQYLGNLEVRFAGDAGAVAGAVRRAVTEVDPNLPVSEVITLAEQVSRSIVDQKLIAQLSSFFGVLAVALASLGIYGLMSYGVSRRTREIGIRMALGTRRWGVLWLILRETLVLAGIGVAVGLIASFAAQRLISSQLYGMNGIDPICLVAAIAILALVAAFAGYLPARRATKVDPMAALRYE